MNSSPIVPDAVADTMLTKKDGESSTRKRLRLLVFSTLYPSDQFPRHGIFLENRIRNLVATGEVEVKVMCPTPWFPASPRWAGEYGRYARLPRRDTRHGIEVLYPRYPVIPRFGMHLAPVLMAAAMQHPVQELITNGFDFDMLDSYYMYPDGVAAAVIARRLGKPYMMTAFGTDINVIPRYSLPRRMIRWAASRAHGVTSVCQALKDLMVGIGIDASRIGVVRHGVDLELFCPSDERQSLRAKAGMSRRTLLSVGHLIELKGNHIVIEAMLQLPDVELFIAGHGKSEGYLRALAVRLGVEDRVFFLGHVDQTHLPDYYRAADALVLCSSREGIANVLMEAMACGLPVMTTQVGGCAEVVNAPAAGVLIKERSVAGVIAAFHALFDNYPDRHETRAHIERYSWAETSAQHLSIVCDVLAQSTGPLHRGVRRPVL